MRPKSASGGDAARGGAGRSASGRASRALPWVALAALCGAGHPASGGPTGGQVVAGSAAIQQTTAQRTDVIQSSQRAVINWRDFSIGAAEQVNFQQPSAQAVVLNRVVGSSVSSLLGQLTANGQVYLVNPNGVFIGPNARIDAAGFLATTTNVATDDFMRDRLRFEHAVSEDGVIVNLGEITAAPGGLVALVAPAVENAGIIRARLGQVALASGSRFTLDLYGDELVQFAVDDRIAERLTDFRGRPLAARVRQAGRVEADGGVVQLTASAARALVDDAINMSGYVRAASVGRENGEIVLRGPEHGMVSVSGTLSAAGTEAGQRGGRVAVTGGQVRLAGSAAVDVSGSAGGGQVRIGGDHQGAGTLPRARKSQVAAGATLRADATVSGDGGSIVVWSDDETSFDGTASARGGAAGGAGGVIEVAGARGLAFRGTANAAAPAGAAGRLLLVSASQVVDETLALAVGDVLGSGTGVVLEASGDIALRAEINGLLVGGTPAAPLSLYAGRDISVGNHVLTDDGAVSLSAGRDIVMADADGVPTYVYSGTSPITLVAGGNITAQHLLTSGAVSVTSGGGAVSLLQDLAYLEGSPGIGTLTVASLRDAAIAGVRTTGAIEVRAGGSVDLRGPLTTAGAVSIEAGTDLLVAAGVHSEGALSLTAAGGKVEIGAGVAVASGGEVQVQGGARGIEMLDGSTLRAGGQGITLGATGPVSLRHLDTAGGVTIGTDTTPVGGPLVLLEDIGAVTAITGLVDLDASPTAVSLSAASVRLEGAIAVRDLLSITSVAGDVEAVNPLRVDAQGNLAADDNVLIAGGGLQIRSAAGVALATPIVVTGQGTAPPGPAAPVSVEAAGAVRVPELISSGREVLLRSTAGDVSAGLVATTGEAGHVTVEGVGLSVADVYAGGAVTLSAERVAVGSGGITARGSVEITGETTLAGDIETYQQPITIRSEAAGVPKPLTIDLLSSPIELRFWATGFSNGAALVDAGRIAALPGGVPEPGNMYYTDANRVYTEALPRFQQWYAILSGEWLDTVNLHVSLSRGRTLDTFVGRSDFSSADPDATITIEASGIALNTRAVGETLAPEINGVLNFVADRVDLSGPVSAVTSLSGDPVTLAVRRAQPQADPATATLTLASSIPVPDLARVTLSQEVTGATTVLFDTHAGNGIVDLPFPAGWVAGALDVTGVGGLSEAQLAGGAWGEPAGRPFTAAVESNAPLGPPPRSFTSNLGGSAGVASGQSVSLTRRTPSAPQPPAPGEPPASPGGSPGAPADEAVTPVAAWAVTDAWFARDEGDGTASEGVWVIGGRGIASGADLGEESAAEGAATDVFAARHHVAAWLSGAHPYFSSDAFAGDESDAEEQPEAD